MTPRCVRSPMALHSVVEVVTRLGETTVALTHVRLGERFDVGPEHGVEAPFTLVESTEHGFVVRRGSGEPAMPLAEPANASASIDLTFGLVTIRVTPTTLVPAKLARRAVDRRPLAYGSGSLAVHVGLLAIATWLAATDEDTAAGTTDRKRRPTRIARFAVAEQTVKREDKPPPLETPITVDESPAEKPITDDKAEGAAASRDSVAMPNGHGEKVPATVDSQASEGSPETGRGFDPDANPNFDTVKLGKYTTVSTGASAGAQYKLAGENGQRKPLIVVSCDSSSCVIIGGDPASGIREALEARLDEIVGCYEKHESTAGKKVELDFGIDSSGKVDTVAVGGVGDYDSCVATIINSLEIPAKK